MTILCFAATSGFNNNGFSARNDSESASHSFLFSGGFNKRIPSWLIGNLLLFGRLHFLQERSRLLHS